MLESRSLRIVCFILFSACLQITTSTSFAEPLQPNARSVFPQATAKECALLEDPAQRRIMDGLLFSLAWRCDRQDLLGEVESEFFDTRKAVTNATDAKVNNDSGTDTTQSETSIAENLDTGTLCSGFNDSCEFFCPGGGGGFTGFSRSTDGGVSFSPVAEPATNVAAPRDLTATNTCGRDALNGNIRYLPGPQITVTSDGTVHVVYSYDPDGQDAGDTIDVFYRRSMNSGATWTPEVRLNDDATTNDQYFPTISAHQSTIQVTFYDRRLDPGNLLQDTYRVVSTDGGVSWGPNERVSDVSSPIELDGNLNPCYHGDYDMSLVTTAGGLVAQWSDDREAGELADTFTDAVSSLFSDNFESGDTSGWTSTVGDI